MSMFVGDSLLKYKTFLFTYFYIFWRNNQYINEKGIKRRGSYSKVTLTIVKSDTGVVDGFSSAISLANALVLYVSHKNMNMLLKILDQ